MTGASKPLISVIFNAFSRKNFIIDCVESLKKQTIDRDKFEILVIKNFSDTDIDDYLQKSKVKIINTTVLGLGNQIAEAVGLAQGKVISFLDDDDRFVRNKLEFVAREFSSNPNLDYLHNEQVIIDENGIPKSKSKLKRGVNQRTDIDSQTKSAFLKEGLFNPRIFHNNSSISVTRKFLESQLERLKLIETVLDLFIFSCAFRAGEVLSFVADELTEYRVHLSESNINTVTTYSIKTTIDFLNKLRITLPVIIGFLRETPLLPYLLNLNRLLEIRIAIVREEANYRRLLGLDYRVIAKYPLYSLREAIVWLFLYGLGVIFPRYAKYLYFKLRSLSF